MKIVVRRFFVFIISVLFLLYAIPYTLYPVYAQQATLSLSPSSGTFNKGCPFALQILLNTSGAQTDGTDAILLYDSSRFSATSISNGTIYSDFPGNNIDDTNGKITVSGLASVASPFSGSGILSTINFSVKATAPEGASQITFDFDPSNKAKTTDSNVVQRSTIADILNSVVNGSYIVGSGTCLAPTPGPGSGGGQQGSIGVGTPSGQQKTIDQVVDNRGKGPGTSELTFTVAIVGGVLTVLGILGLVLL